MNTMKSLKGYLLLVLKEIVLLVKKRFRYKDYF